MPIARGGDLAGGILNVKPPAPGPRPTNGSVYIYS